MGTSTLRDPELVGVRLATALRDRAIDLVGTNANAAWFGAALRAVAVVALRQESFTTDDLVAVVEGDVSTHELRAWGAVLRTAKLRRMVEPTSGWQLSTQPTCHRRPKRIWRSLLRGTP